MSKTRRLAVDGMLAALYFALSMLTFTSANQQIRFTALALILTALLFRVPDVCAVALVGEFFYQLIRVGLTPTTPIWLLPPVLHGLLLGLGASLVRKCVPEKRQLMAFFLVCIGCGLLNAGFNTAALWADSLIMGYYSAALVFGVLPLRLLIAVLTAAVTSAVAIPMLQFIQRRKL